jgi:flagellar motor switch protein FliN/FliY
MSEDAEKSAISADDWASAMAEQEATAPAAVVEDDWAAAMAEQAVAEDAPAAAPEPQKAQIFQPIAAGAAQPAANNLDLILDIPVQMTVELGRTKITIRNLLQLAQGSVVELDGLAGEPMDVLVNGCLIAQGEVVVVNDKFGIRLTDIISPAERLRRINK